MQTQGAPARNLGSDFWKFWTGQAISSLGTSFTGFALPLLIYKLTGSAVNLALGTAANFVPYLLFGLVIGAWADRSNRKRLMIVVDIARALVIASIPLAALAGVLSIWWIYAMLFLNSTLSICFDAADFAAIPSLVDADNLVTANGRIQASYSVTFVLGPLLGGLLVAILPLEDLLVIDAASFLVSAFSLTLVRRSFNTTERREPTSLRHDVVEGLRYVLSHPVLRNISAMMALVNFVGSTINTQIVLFAERQLGANDAQVGLLFSAGSVGIVLLSLLAGPLRKRLPFSKVALGALMIDGLLTVVLAVTRQYWLAVPVWALIMGFGVLFNINTSSLRQAIVPNHLLGRVMSIAGVLAWSAIPVGSYLGGVAIERTGSVTLVYAAIGVMTFLIPLFFAFTPLGHAEQYLPPPNQPPASEPAPAA